MKSNDSSNGPIGYIIGVATSNKQIVLTVIITLIVLGIYALFQMPRQEFPDFVIRQGIVVGIYPGASSRQVEEQLTTKVENYLFGLQEVNKKKTYSISREGVMVIFVELHENVKLSDVFWSKCRNGLNELKAQLPLEVLALVASNDFGDTSALILAIESQGKTYKELEEYVKQLECELRKLDATSKVRRFGVQKEQICIYIDDEKLALYGISPLTVLGLLKTEGAISYAGEVDNGKIIIPIHVPPRYRSEQDIAQQIIYADPLGNIIRVKDVARVAREYQEPDSFVKTNGKKCLLVSLEMQSGNNIVQFGNKIDAAIGKVSKSLPHDVNIHTIVSMPRVVAASMEHFFIEFVTAVVAVIIVTFFLLPLKVAAVAAITIPISILITLNVLNVMGIALHTVSLASLIIVLGMVVDNAIVVIDNHLEKLDHGEPPLMAARKSAVELAVPVFSATLAIIIAYFPLMFFLTGIAGDFVAALPITVAVALSVSFFIAILLVPIMNMKFIRTGLKTKGDKVRPSLLDGLQMVYNATLGKAFHFSKTTITLGMFVVILGIAMATFVSRQLFPLVERNQFAVEIYLSEGNALDQTAKIVKDLETLLMADKRITNVTSFVGTSSPRFHTTYAPNFPAKNYAQLIVNTISNKVTEEILDEYSQKWRDHFPNAYVRFKQLEMSSSSAPIEIRISGDDIKTLKQVASRIGEMMKTINGIVWVRNDFEQPSESIRLDVNQDETNRLGLTKSVLAYSLAMGFGGLPLTTLWEGDHPVELILKREKDRRQNADDIRNQHVSTFLPLATVPIRQIAALAPEWSEGRIVRRNGVRTLTVKADVARGIIASSIFSIVRSEIERIKLPDEINIEFGGEYEGEIENYGPMAKSLFSSIVLTFFVLLFQFRRISLALLVMVTMPLGLLGSILGLLILGYPFGFTSFVGIISLSGMVVRNGIIFVDYAEQLNRDQGLSIADAAFAAGKRRMRPIFLTSAAAAIGVIPMIINPSPLWGPLATVVCFGLMFSMAVTLHVLPVLYAVVAGPAKDQASSNQPSSDQSESVHS